MHHYPIDAYVDEFQQWIENYLCAQWLPAVYCSDVDLFAESLHQAPAYHRVMVVARQIFTLSALIRHLPQHPSRTNWEQQLERQAWHLQHTFYQKPEKQWLFSIFTDGSPHRTDQELYSYAFIIFAFAELLRSHPHYVEPDCLHAVLDHVKLFFDPQTQEWCSKKTYQGAVLEGAAQNPLMHLFEAFCSLHQVAPEKLPVVRIVHLWEYVHRTFYVPSVSAIAELPIDLPPRVTQGMRYFDRTTLQNLGLDAFAGNRLESGHQFEWAYLLYQSPLLSEITLDNLREGVLYHSDRVMDYPLVPLSMELDYLTPIQDQSRIWVQCEWIRILASLRKHYPKDERLLSYLTKALQILNQRFLHTAGWYEVLDYAGTPLRADQPTSTAYHLVGCWLALKA